MSVGDGTILLPELTSNCNNNNCDGLLEATAMDGSHELSAPLDAPDLGKTSKAGDPVETTSVCQSTASSESSTCQFTSPLETSACQPALASESSMCPPPALEPNSLAPLPASISEASTSLPMSASESSTYTTRTVSETLSCPAASTTSASSTLKAVSDRSLGLQPSGGQPLEEEGVRDDLSHGVHVTSVGGREQQEESLTGTEKQLQLPPRSSPTIFFNEDMTLEAALIMTHSEQEGSELVDAHMRNIRRVVSARKPQLSDDDNSLKSVSDPLVYGDLVQQANTENVPMTRWSIPSLESNVLPLLEETDGARVRQASGRG